MKGFSPPEESYGFSPDLLWYGLRSGCRVTKSRRSRSESEKLIGATGLPAVFLEGLPWGSTGVTDNDWFAFLAQQPEIDEVNFWQPERHKAFKRGRRQILCLFKWALRKDDRLSSENTMRELLYPPLQNIRHWRTSS